MQGLDCSLHPPKPKTDKIMNREQAFETLRAMSFEMCIGMWNESACDHYMRAYEIHEMDDDNWWDWIQKEIGSGYWYMRYLLQSQSFNVTDRYFFYDTEISEFFSFSTKADMLEIIGDDFFIEELINRK